MPELSACLLAWESCILSAMMQAMDLLIRVMPHECQWPCESMDRACVSGAALAK